MDRSKDKDIVISPLDFMDLESDKPKRDEDRTPSDTKLKTHAPVKKKHKSVFITGTDTEVGKTVATAAIGLLLQEKGLDVGVMKPLQCGGKDTHFLMKTLNVKDAITEVNPYYSKEALSPNLAFKRKEVRIDIEKIKKHFSALQAKHDIVLVEGAGGISVPLTDKYFVLDLIKDLGCDVIIVARLGLGTINHSLLTLHTAQEAGLKVKGMLFNEARKSTHGIAEKTNPEAIRHLGSVSNLGTIPYLNRLDKKEILSKCRRQVNINSLIHHRAHTHRSRQLSYWDKKYLWHPFTQMKDWLKEEPVVIDEGRGSFLIDADGKKYIDGVSSLWVNIHGHRKDTIDKAVKNQLNRLGHSTLLGLSNAPSVELAKKLVEITPRGLEKVFYSDNGSTAVEVAVKMAYQYWQNTGHAEKIKILHLSNSYHGDTCGGVSIGGIDLFRKVYKNLIFEAIQIEFPDGYRCPKGKVYPDYTYECLENLEKLFKQKGKSIAAFVIEPIVQGAGGMLVWPKGVLKQIKELCLKYNILLIADEVATGFGRTGKMFACEHEHVTPDFLCLAKGLTGGYLPLAATLTTKKVFDGFLYEYSEQKTFFHGHTYTGNPIACSAALANIKIFEKEKTLSTLEKKITYLEKRLKEFSKLQHVGDIRQKGFMVGIELVRDKKLKTPYSWDEGVGVKVCQEVRRRGAILRPLGNVIVLMPPLSISKKELDYLLSAAYAAIELITEKKSQTKKRQYYKRRQTVSRRK